MAIVESNGQLKDKKQNGSRNDKKVDQQRATGSPRRSTSPLRRVLLPQRTRNPEIKGLRSATAKPPSPQRSKGPFPLRELEKTLAFWAIDGPASQGIKRE